MPKLSDEEFLQDDLTDSRFSAQNLDGFRVSRGCMSNNCIDPVVAAILVAIHSLDKSAHLVGGLIRDHFLGRSDSADLDFAVKGDGFEICRQIAREIVKDAVFVPLDQETGTGRLVIPRQFPIVVDISTFKGENILEDLPRRDFTINAMAVPLLDFLNSGFSNAIDPCGGRDDLVNRRVRACSENSFKEDPLRILRVFRFSSILDFEIVPETLQLIAPSVQLLSSVAPERIRDELFAVLSVRHCAETLEELDRWRILDVLLPEVIPSKGCIQNDYHHLDVWGHSLETVRQLEEIMESIPLALDGFQEEIRAYLDEQLVKGRPRTTLLKLAALLHDTGKPKAKTVDSNGRVRFFGHETISKFLFDDMGNRLKLARREIETIGKWISGHMRPLFFASPSVSRRAVHRIIREFGEDIVGLSLLFVADLNAARGPARDHSEIHDALAGVRNALNEYFVSLKTRSAPLLNGNDLMALLTIKQGPLLGRIIRELRELQDAGHITTPDQALSAARRLLVGNEDGAQFPSHHHVQILNNRGQE